MKPVDMMGFIYSCRNYYNVSCFEISYWGLLAIDLFILLYMYMYINTTIPSSLLVILLYIMSVQSMASNLNEWSYM